jgi:hypothetical protein
MVTMKDSLPEVVKEEEQVPCHGALARVLQDSFEGTRRDAMTKYLLLALLLAGGLSQVGCAPFLAGAAVGAAANEEVDDDDD